LQVNLAVAPRGSWW